jgi:uncharacterized protein (DUF1330 family)
MIARRDGYELSDEKGRIDLEATWRFLRTAYWSPNVPREVVERAIAASSASASTKQVASRPTGASASSRSMPIASCRFGAGHNRGGEFEAGLDERTVIIEFESVEQAVAAYQSEGYQKALRALGDGAERDLRIVEAIA